MNLFSSIEDDYNMAVAEYADVLVDIHAVEAAYLSYTGEEEDDT